MFLNGRIPIRLGSSTGSAIIEKVYVIVYNEIGVSINKPVRVYIGFEGSKTNEKNLLEI